MIEAVDVRTCGLGGDSEIHFDRDGGLRAGPRRVVPLSLLAQQFPQVLRSLAELAGAERLAPPAGQFAYRNPGGDSGARLDRLERRVWDLLDETPRGVEFVARTAQSVQALWCLVDRGLATLAGFTPSDALHVLGHQSGWSAEAARLGAGVLAAVQRHETAGARAQTPEELCASVHELVIRQATRVVLESALAQDPGIEVPDGRWGPLGVLIERLVQGRPFSGLLDVQLRLPHPLVAVGAPARAFYADVARRLGASLLIPEHAAVCNAVGAVAGVVSETREVLVNQPEYNVFRVHDPAGLRDFNSAREAIELATRISRELALSAARRAGAREPHLETMVIERRAHAQGSADYLAEATVRSRATGRPSTARS